MNSKWKRHYRHIDFMGFMFKWWFTFSIQVHQLQSKFKQFGDGKIENKITSDFGWWNLFEILDFKK